MNYTYYPGLKNFEDLKSVIPLKLYPERYLLGLETIKQVQDMLDLPFPIQKILYFGMYPNFVGWVHKDKEYRLVHSDLEFAIIIPLHNCESTYMKWFKETGDATVVPFPGPRINQQLSKLLPECAEQTEQLLVDQPAVINIQDWHSINNYSTDKFSSVISLRFDTSIRKADMLDRL